METIDTNLDIIEAVKAEVKRVGSITTDHLQSYPALLAERIADTPTEQYINGTRTTASGASIDKGIAVLKGLRGKAVKVNQLVNVTNQESAGIRITRNANGSVSFEGTNTGGGKQIIRFCSFEQSLNGVSHKVLAYANLQGGIDEPQLWSEVSTYGIFMQIQGSGWEMCFGKQPLIGTTSDGGYYALSLVIADGQTINETVFPMVFDLTAMGLENCNTADEVAKALGYASIADMPYIPYTEGEILVSKPSRLISKDADGDVLDSLAITLPSLFADGILSVGDVADEWGTKATKRCGMEILNGTELWVAVQMNDIQAFAHPVSNYASSKSNMICSSYVRGTDSSTFGDKMYWTSQWWVEGIHIADLDYADVDTWKSHLAELYAQGNPLVILYELATPIEEQTPFPIGFYKAEPNGTEEVQDAESIPTLLDGFIGYEGMDTIANLASAWGIDADKVGKVDLGSLTWDIYGGFAYPQSFPTDIRQQGGGNDFTRTTCSAYDVFHVADEDVPSSYPRPFFQALYTIFRFWNFGSLNGSEVKQLLSGVFLYYEKA